MRRTLLDAGVVSLVFSASLLAQHGPTGRDAVRKILAEWAKADQVTP
jgi:hypothetical protein